LCFRDKCAASVAPAGVSLLQAEELDLLGYEVEDVHHGGGCEDGVRWLGVKPRKVGRRNIRLRVGIAQLGLGVRGRRSTEVFSCSS